MALLWAQHSWCSLGFWHILTENFCLLNAYSQIPWLMITFNHRKQLFGQKRFRISDLRTYCWLLALLVQKLRCGHLWLTYVFFACIFGLRIIKREIRFALCSQRHIGNLVIQRWRKHLVRILQLIWHRIRPVYFALFLNASLHSYHWSTTRYVNCLNQSQRTHLTLVPPQGSNFLLIRTFCASVIVEIPMRAWPLVPGYQPLM